MALRREPHVLVVGGSDSSGGAGIARDIETISSIGVRTSLAVTALTVQTHETVKEIDAKRYRVEIDEDYRWVLHSAPARDGALNLGRWLWRWPNLAVNLYADGMNVERYDPLGPSRTRVRYSFAFAEPSAATNAETVRLSGMTLDEDRAICEAVQRNLDSGVYTSGVLSPRYEQGVAAFQRWLVDAVS